MPNFALRTWITYLVFCLLLIIGMFGVCSQTMQNRQTIREDVEIGQRIERKLDDVAKRLPGPTTRSDE